jgi:RNA polymerase sigma-70 factor (ECF subfamily)
MLKGVASPTGVGKESPSDDELMRALASGNHQALEPLHRRYAPAIYRQAARSLEPSAAHEIVQDVFLTIWREAATFDPARGEFRSWVMQIARFRVANELRRRSRRPTLEADAEWHVDAAPDQGPQPAEALWREYRRAVVQKAFDELPPTQRQALALAFFEDLTHAQVAAALNQPLGTTKTRIRAGLQKLRGRLTSEIAAVGLVAMLALFGVRYRWQRSALELDERALALVTMSDTTDWKLTPPAGGLPESDGTHARYRGRAGAEIAVLTWSHFPAPAAGHTYQAWILQRGTWLSLGTLAPDANGNGRQIIERPELASLPEAVEVTLEPESGSTQPAGEVVVAWPGR